MEYVGFDLGKNASQICLLTETGEQIERRIKTERGTLTEFFGARQPARIVIEASTESEWVAQHLESLGHEVIVADPNFAPMYATRSKKIKTDKRDARALCEACQLGAYRAAHRTSAAQRHIRAKLAVRETLVRTRAKYISLIGAIVRREGWRLASGSSRAFLTRLAQLALTAEMENEIAPLKTVMETLNEQIQQADQELATLVRADEQAQRLTTVPGIGPVTATAFIATLDEVKRFDDAKQVRSYLGLVPRESSSGERQWRGAISKTGHKRLRCLLVEAALAILHKWRKAPTAALQRWGEQIALRRGKKIAAVALARKLAGILYARWRDGTEFRGDLGVAQSAEVMS